jgi:hypothetical protein
MKGLPFADLFPTREDVTLTINRHFFERIEKYVDAEDRGDDDTCLFWNRKTLRISYGMHRKENVKRLIYHNCVGDLLDNHRIYQTCGDRTCIQPLHLVQIRCEKGSLESLQKRRKRKRDYYKNKTGGSVRPKKHKE